MSNWTGSPMEYIHTNDLYKMSDSNLIQSVVEKVLTKHSDKVDKCRYAFHVIYCTSIHNIYLVILYRKGKHQLVNYFVGEAMMQSRFRIDQDILEKVMI
jgi:Asp-tRNA(Asn)/Glu-tRNA(Gln) amidotransferase B subunit